MTITAKLADGRILKFPDGTDPAVMQATVKNMMGVNVEAPLRPEQAATPMDEDFIPTGENLAAEQARTDAIQNQTTEADVFGFESAESNAAIAPFLKTQTATNVPFGDELAGATEAVATMATGATTGALGFGLGTVEGVTGELTGGMDRGEGLKEAQKYAEALTYLPKTKEGQAIVKFIGEKLSSLPPTVGLGATPSNLLVAQLKPLVIGKAINAKLFKSSRAKRALLADEIVNGNPNIDLVAKTLNANGDIITSPASKRAVKMLGGDDIAKGTVVVAENMSPASKSQLKKMLDVIDRGRKDPLFKDANRPSDILGESMANRAKAVSFQNKQAGTEIGKVATSLDDISINISEPKVKFVTDLRDMGVTFSRGEDGWVTPDFSRSKFDGGSAQKMTVLINDLMNDTPSFNTAHKLKQLIRDNVNYETGVGGVGQVKGASEAVLKGLARGIDDILDATSPKYKKANEKFAKTIKLKEDWDKMAGKNIDIESDLSAKALGGKGMRLDSNAESRVHIEQTLLNTDKVLKELGVTFKDDIPSLVHMTGKLNDAFKLAPGGSFKGNVISGGLEVADAAAGNPAAVARIAEKMLKKDPDFGKKMRAFRTLINQQDK
tara:strand:- start:40 stop:1866 length:1827 start_codon:yes stop_codon:yes gene_type:complete